MVSCFIPSKLHPLIFSACEKEAKKISAWQRMVSSGEILETMGNYRGENKRREKEKKGKTSFSFHSVPILFSSQNRTRNWKIWVSTLFSCNSIFFIFSIRTKQKNIIFLWFYPFSLQFLRSKWSHNNITLIKKLRWRDKVAYSSIPLWPTQNGLTRVWQKWTVHANFSQSISVGACLGIILVAQSWYQKNIFCKSEKLTSSCHLQYKP